MAYYDLPDGRKFCVNCNRSATQQIDEEIGFFDDLQVCQWVFFRPQKEWADRNDPPTHRMVDVDKKCGINRCLK